MPGTHRNHIHQLYIPPLCLYHTPYRRGSTDPYLKFSIHFSLEWEVLLLFLTLFEIGYNLMVDSPATCSELTVLYCTIVPPKRLHFSCLSDSLTINYLYCFVKVLIMSCEINVYTVLSLLYTELLVKSVLVASKIIKEWVLIINLK